MEKNNSEFNRNDRQLHFNQIKGTISELNDGNEFCSITLDVGHENVRKANLVMKKKQFDVVAPKFSLGDKVSIRYYLVSRKKHDRWYTMANVLEVHRD